MNAHLPAQAMTVGNQSGPIDWEVAAATAVRLIGPGPAMELDQAQEIVRKLRKFSVTAEEHVRVTTGLGLDLPFVQGEVVDRASWVRSATDGLAALLEQALANNEQSQKWGVTTGINGVQVGLVLAYLSSKVLGQYDPFNGTGKLLLVAPNIVAAQRSLEVAEDDFALWVCLHEAAHRLQFTAVPWLREYFVSQISQLLSTMDESLATLLNRAIEAVRAKQTKNDYDVASQDKTSGLLGLVRNPSQLDVFDRLIALSTLLEGHADYVMDAVGLDVVPSVATLRSRLTDRRKPRGLVDRMLRTLLGVDAKVRQYAEGSAFVSQVVREVGMSGLNHIWQEPNTLPTRQEIASPASWLTRVFG